MKIFLSSLLIFAVSHGSPVLSNCDTAVPMQPCDPCETLIIPPPCICGYNTPARIDVRGCFGVHAKGSYLYWEPKLEGIDLGIRSDTDFSEFGGGIQNGSIVNFDYKFKSGFKAGLAVLYDYDHWEIEAMYTYYKPTQRVSDEGFICPKWIDAQLIDLVNFARSTSATWDLDIDMLDFHFARRYYVGKKFTLRPFFGGEIQWIDQDFNVEYVDGIFRTLVSENKINLRAYGTRAGIESNWIFGQFCRLIGSIAGSILYTDYDLSTKQYFSNLPDFVRSSITVNDVWCLRPHAEMQFGFAIGDYFCCERFYIDIGAMYEFHVFWNQNMFFLIYDTNCPKTLQTGDLYLHGLTATLTLAF